MAGGGLGEVTELAANGGQAQHAAGRSRSPRRRLFEPTADDEGTSAQQTAAMAAALPHLARLAEVALHEAEGSLSVCDSQAEFEFTLDLILDGLEVRRPT